MEIKIKDQTLNILLLADDQFCFNPSTGVFFYNLSSYLIGSAFLVSEELAKLGIECVTFHLDSNIFKDVMRATKQDLAKYLISNNSDERKLAERRVKLFDQDKDNSLIYASFPLK